MEYVIIVIALLVVVGIGYWLSSTPDPVEDRIEPVEDEEPVTEPEPIDETEEPPTIAVEELGLDEHVESLLLDEGLNTVSDLRGYGDFTDIHGIGPARSKKIYQSVIDYVKENEIERIDVKDL